MSDLESDAAPALALSDLGPIAQFRAGRLPRRLVQLYFGLVLYGLSIAMMIRGRLGVAPWDVLHTGLSRHLHIEVGHVLIIVSFIVLLAWVPLREVPGLGTISNAVILGLAADAALAWFGRVDSLTLRIVLMLVGIVLCAFSTALYIGAQFGRGPRDGLMTGLHRRTGYSLRAVRTALEVAVLIVGIVLGGSIGIGTFLFAFAIGPLTQMMLPRWIVRLDR